METNKTQTAAAKLNLEQREALALMSARNLGAVLTRLGWTWPQAVRESEDAAAAVIEALTPGGTP